MLKGLYETFSGRSWFPSDAWNFTPADSSGAYGCSNFFTKSAGCWLPYMLSPSMMTRSNGNVRMHVVHLLGDLVLRPIAGAVVADGGKLQRIRSVGKREGGLSESRRGRNCDEKGNRSNSVPGRRHKGQREILRAHAVYSTGFPFASTLISISLPPFMMCPS